MHPHFPRDVSQYDMAIIQLDPKHGIRKRLRYRALDFNNVFFCHVLLYSFLITGLDLLQLTQNTGCTAGLDGDRMLKMSG
jgi:hypothetical protein